MPDFNDKSTDSMFATILAQIKASDEKWTARLDIQDNALIRIEEQTTKTNGRVTSLERDRWYQRGIAATLAIIFSAGVEIFRGGK